MLLSFNAEMDPLDDASQPPLFYVCQAGLEGMILGMLKNGAAAATSEEKGGKSHLDAIREANLRARAQEAAGAYAAEQEAAKIRAEEERAGGAAEMATDQVPVPDDAMDMAPDFPGGDMDLDMDMDMGLFGAGMGGRARRRPRRDIKPFTEKVKSK